MKKDAFLVTVFSSFISGFAITIISGFLLVSSSVFANADTVSESVDASVNVSMACSMSGIGMNSHNAEIANGQYNSDIGETTLKAYCNDNEGFSIYAIGYTDDTEGKNVLTDAQLGNTHDIQTGTALSGNSQWAMRLFAPASPTPTYPVSIQNSFDSFHAVPNDYALVAKRTAGTDAGENAEGSTLKTTYQAYISNTQKAGTYNGKVKYVMVHPNTAPIPVSDNQIGVVYDGNGMNFANGKDQNRVVYNTVNEIDYYLGDTTVVKSSNITDRDTYEPYSSGENILRTIARDGADRMQVTVKYGLSADTMWAAVVEGEWDCESAYPEYYKEYFSDSENIAGEEITVFESDTVTICIGSSEEAIAGYDFGAYFEVSPIYEDEHSGATPVYIDSIDYVPVSGAYATIPNQFEEWYAVLEGKSYNFASESEVLTFVRKNAGLLKGDSLMLYRALTIDEAFAKAGKTMTGNYYKMQDLDGHVCKTLRIGQSATLQDSRDNNTYLVKRLKDGNCWMLENLRLDPTNSTTAGNMSAFNTNAPTAAINNYFSGGNTDNVPGWTSVAVNNFFDTDTATPSVYNDEVNTLVTAFGPSAVNDQAKVGILYDLCAATLGTYCYVYRGDVDVPGTLQDAPYDVCPANWRLPTGGPYGEQKALIEQYNGTIDPANSNSLQYNYSVALSGAMSGHYGYGLSNRGWFGWSSTYSGNYAFYSLSVESDSGYEAVDYIDDQRDVGYSVRCIVKP